MTKTLWHDAIEDPNPFTWDDPPAPPEVPADTADNPSSIKVGGETGVARASSSAIVSAVAASTAVVAAATSPRHRVSSFMGDWSPARAWRNRDMSTDAVRARKRFCWAFALVCVCVSIGLLAASLKKVSSTEMGVEVRLVYKKLCAP